MRHIFAFTGITNSTVSVTVKRGDSKSQVSRYHLSSYNFLDLQFSPTMQTVVHIYASQAVSIFGDIEEDNNEHKIDCVLENCSRNCVKLLINICCHIFNV